MSLFGDIGQGIQAVGRGLFAQTLPGQYLNAMEEAKRRHQKLAAFTATLGPTPDVTPTGNDAVGGLPHIGDPPKRSPYSDTQITLAREAFARGHPEQADAILAGHPYTLGPTDTRFDGGNQQVAAGRPAPYTLNGPTGAGDVRYNGADQAVAGFVAPGIAVPGGPPLATGSPQPTPYQLNEQALQRARDAEIERHNREMEKLGFGREGRLGAKGPPRLGAGGAGGWIVER